MIQGRVRSVTKMKLLMVAHINILVRPVGIVFSLHDDYGSKASHLNNNTETEIIFLTWLPFSDRILGSASPLTSPLPISASCIEIT
jgi:hypothetical protein